MGTKRVDVRLDDTLFERINEFRKESGIATPSQAIRVLLEESLVKVSQLDATWRKAAWAEGRREGYTKILADLNAVRAR